MWNNNNNNNNNNIRAGRPGGVWQVIFEPGIIGQFSWVWVPHSYKFGRTFSCAQIDLREARERELATFDEKSTSSAIIAEPYGR